MAPDGDTDSLPRQWFTAVLLGLCFSPGSTDFNKNRKHKSPLTFLREHNPKPEKPTLKDYTYIISGLE